MRLIAFLATLAALAAAAGSGRALWLALQAPPPSAPELAAPQGSAPPAPAPEPAAPRVWPALFGEPMPPAPPAPEPQPPAPEPQPPAPPMPPLDSLGYRLKGVVSNGNAVWALVSHPTGELILRRGDPFAEGLVVARIDEAGLWVAPAAGGDPALLGFAE